MQGKTIVVTGGTSGIGEVAALTLAAQGARIVLVAREKARGEATLRRLEESGTGRGHQIHYGDLAQLSEMKRVAAEIATAEPKIDVLINNAGAMFANRELTKDGFERTFALNHLSYFVMTAGLRASLLAAPAARIVNTSSDAHKTAHFDIDDLQTAKNYKSFEAYSRSKLANILFTRELAHRLKGTSLTTNCLHPGFVATRFGDEAGGLIAHIIGFGKLLAISPEEGAKTIIYLATSPEVATTSGGYFYKSRQARPTAAGRNDELARALWQKSVEMTGVDWA
ncbi:MAG: SDR family oxidoreductase [Methylovirgula sp.]|jgi:NAD(P)-dependent dehydrogenase (short-subunit alcohol dehydrogenase family)